MSGLKLGGAPARYDAGEEARNRAALERADAQNLKAGVAAARLLLRSPSGRVWAVTVNDAGALAAAPYG